tara:strand:- start:355 stop:1122 length:768 start_codon:yes stop_codon:yes gene_type:complete
MKTQPKALIFDMDGTITDSGQPISNEMILELRSLKPGLKKHLVTGASLAKVEKQIPTTVLLGIFDRVYTCNGTMVYNCDLDMDDETRPIEPDLIHQVRLKDHYSDADINHIISVLLKIAAKTHTKIKTGTFIDWRESQINFSVIGRNCTLSQREDYVLWDNKSNERRKIIQQLREEFTGWGLSFRLGGQISIDISREGWDKSYAFENMLQSPSDCVFFGDKIIKDGNDLDIAMKCAYYHSVESPADTILQIQEYK